MSGTPADNSGGRARYWLIGAVLLVTHLATAYWRYHIQSPEQFICPYTNVARPGLQYSSPLDAWEQAAIGSDSSSYLHVARNFANGLGVQAFNKALQTPVYEPFTYWGPGAPVTLGIWIAVTGGETGDNLFTFATVALLVFGAVTVLTAALFTKNTWALCLTAFLTGFCPPFFNYYYSIYLSSSEVTCLVPLSLMYYSLARAFLAYQQTELSWKVSGKWFALAGAALGIASLSRDSLAQFGLFVALFLGMGTLWHRTKAHFRRAIIAGLCIFGATTVTRMPVEAWNQYRVKRWYVSSSTKTAIWRYALWMKHDAAPWLETAGAGLGEYLDPEAAKEVEANFESNSKLPQLYSLWRFVQAVATHPIQAVTYKGARLPVLFLGTPPLPDFVATFSTVWSTGAYCVFLIYLGIRLWTRQPVPAIVYLYAFFLLCCSPLIHFEYRYSFPCWHGLLLVPALLIEHFVGRCAANQDGSADCRSAPSPDVAKQVHARAA